MTTPQPGQHPDLRPAGPPATTPAATTPTAGGPA